MCLSISHDCFIGAYSDFMAWRRELHKYFAPCPDHTLDDAWTARDYDDQSVAINVLMNHSDCDGIIPADVCTSLAASLLEALHWLYEGDPDNPHTRTTMGFILGLLRAAKNNEDVVFS